MEALAATAIGLVAPYLAKGAEEFAKEAGAEAYEAVKRLFGRLKRWWDGEPVAAAAATHLADDPGKYAKVLADSLAHDMASDPELGKEIQALVDGASPHAEVIQRIQVAQDVTGAEVEQFARGTVRVEQIIGQATNVTGFKATRMGP